MNGETYYNYLYIYHMFIFTHLQEWGNTPYEWGNDTTFIHLSFDNSIETKKVSHGLAKAVDREHDLTWPW